MMGVLSMIYPRPIIEEHVVKKLYELTGGNGVAMLCISLGLLAVIGLITVCIWKQSESVEKSSDKNEDI